MELEINNQKYRVGNIPVMKQMHIARRLAPVFAAAAGAVKQTPEKSGVAELVAAAAVEPIVDTAGGAMFSRLANAISQLSDADTEYILNLCLDVCMRQNGDKWTPVRVRGQLMYDDIALPDLLQISFATIQENLGTFFPVNRQVSPSAQPG